MPKVIRATKKDKSQGHHGCCEWKPMAPEDGNTKKVYVEGLLAMVKGGRYAGHECNCGKTPMVHPGPVAAAGSPNVKIGGKDGKPLHRDGDPISCGDSADNGSTTVLCNEGVVDYDDQETRGYVVNKTIPDTVELVFKYDYKEGTKLVNQKTQRVYTRTFRGAYSAEYSLAAHTNIARERVGNPDDPLTYPNYPKNHPLVVDNQVPAGAELPPGAPSKLEDPIPIISRGLRVDKNKFDKLPELAPGLRWVMDGEYYVGVAGKLTAIPCTTPRGPVRSSDEYAITLSSQFQGEQMIETSKGWVQGPPTIWEGFEVTMGQPPAPALKIIYVGNCVENCSTSPTKGTPYCK